MLDYLSTLLGAKETCFAAGFSSSEDSDSELIGFARVCLACFLRGERGAESLGRLMGIVCLTFCVGSCGTNVDSESVRFIGDVDS